MEEPVLVRWMSTFAEFDPASTPLASFSDGDILLCVAQDTILGFDFAGAPPGLPGLLLALEHAYEVCGAAPQRLAPRPPA